MLHILLLILKIAGMIIASILGILVLLVCVAIFVPFRYRIQASSDGTLDGIRAEGKGSFLLHLVTVRISYVQGKLSWRARIAWKRFSDEQSVPGSEAEQKEPEQTVREEGGMDVYEIEKKDNKLEKSSEKRKSDTQEAYEPRIQEAAGEGDKEAGRFRKIIEKGREIIHKIKCTIADFCDKIKALLEKKDRLEEFISDEAHRAAFGKVKTELFHLLGRLKPGKLKAAVHYGFEDPYTTGRVLAGLSVLYPFIGEHTDITPDFEHKVLEGDLFVKGKIKVLYFVIAAWNLFWCRNVRMTYHHIREFKW